MEPASILNRPAQESNAVQLSGTLDIYSAAELKTRLSLEIEARDEITLDLSQVDACDAAGVQLLIAATRAAGDRGKILTIVNRPEAVENVIHALGIQLSGTRGT